MENFAMKKRGLLLAVLLCLVVSSCCAGQVTLLSGQKEYYFLTGEDAVLPLTLNNTYDHDVTGVLRYSTVAEKPGGNATIVQGKTFTLFTGQRSYLLPVGRSETPLICQSDIVFLYPDDGGRRATLDDIIVHFVKSQSEVQINQSPQESIDSPDPEAGSSNSMSTSGATTPAADPLRMVQNNQVRQDITSLQQQIQKEDADSQRRKKEFLSLLMQDSTISEIDRSLVKEGFELRVPEVSPVTNRSGNFSFSYEKKGQSAVVFGSVDEGRFLFADESSGSTIPLPDLLRNNETFRSYENELAAGGFLQNATLMQYTPERIAVNLTYGDAKNRFTHLKVMIVNGTIISIERETMEELSTYLVPFLSVLLICLLSGGILFLGRRLPRSPPPAVETSAPELLQSGYRQIAESMLDEAGELARQDRYPDAYARAGQALRFVLSHTMSDGNELTNEEAAHMLSLHSVENDRIIKTLERCSMVAFAKTPPDPEEFRGILKCVRDLLASEDRRDTIQK
jgi:hypothetical protein